MEQHEYKFKQKKKNSLTVGTQICIRQTQLLSLSRTHLGWSSCISITFLLQGDSTKRGQMTVLYMHERKSKPAVSFPANPNKHKAQFLPNHWNSMQISKGQFSNFSIIKLNLNYTLSHTYTIPKTQQPMNLFACPLRKNDTL